MSRKREEHKREEEERAKRFLRDANLRWPTSTNTYLNLLLVVLITLLVYVVW